MTTNSTEINVKYELPRASIVFLTNEVPFGATMKVKSFFKGATRYMDGANRIIAKACRLVPVVSSGCIGCDNVTVDSCGSDNLLDEDMVTNGMVDDSDIEEDKTGKSLGSTYVTETSTVPYRDQTSTGGGNTLVENRTPSNSRNEENHLGDDMVSQTTMDRGLVNRVKEDHAADNNMTNKTDWNGTDGGNITGTSLGGNNTLGVMSALVENRAKPESSNEVSTLDTPDCENTARMQRVLHNVICLKRVVFNVRTRM
ncbi:hypothetical protein ScPMuIL_016980 [Solemya velum]